ncbi:oxidoreductase-like domain-containing protein [Phanerochaete sordida]|uniref:Oxidoreductase-like domain-containing protein n=1 Tax=Phanerochaete sordida TaxID=48140 RepID=A0A9P3G1M5_9APHY|nr:oxidoreductase-like domain-containing protein [Phanerochaete sordida]
MGFVIPEEPKPPGPDECCMSGCAICVQDLYIEALDEYKKATDSVRASLNALHIPEDRWPPEIQTTGSSQKAKPKLSPVYDAFAELERKLAEKHQAESHAGALPKPPAIGRPRKRKEKLPDVQLLYEGIRWVLFSNR